MTLYIAIGQTTDYSGFVAAPGIFCRLVPPFSPSVFRDVGGDVCAHIPAHVCNGAY